MAFIKNVLPQLLQVTGATGTSGPFPITMLPCWNSRSSKMVSCTDQFFSPHIGHGRSFHLIFNCSINFLESIFAISALN